MEDITEQLRNESYSKLMLILREFGGEPSDPNDSWNGGFDDEADYLRKHLCDLKDHELLELREYAGSTTLPERVDWERGLVRMFISHLAAQRQLVTSYKNEFEYHGFSCFVAHQSIRPSLAWRESIEAHLTTCDLVVAFVHPGFFQSEWTAQEVGWGLGAGKPLISIGFDRDTPLQGFMSARQAILAGDKKTSEIQTAVIRSCTQDSLIGPRLRTAAFDRLIHARSFHDTMRSAALLSRHYPPLSAAEAALLRQASRENTQISHCIGGRKDVEFLLQTAERPLPSMVDDEPF